MLCCKKVVLAHLLAVWSDENVPVVKTLGVLPDVNSLGDVALNDNVEKVAAVVDPQAVPEKVSGANADEKKRNFAVTLQHRLFPLEPTAVLRRMVEDAEVSIANDALRTNVVNFLAKQRDCNIRTTSVYRALQNPEAFKGVAEDHMVGVVEQLKTLAACAGVLYVPEAVPVLMRANLTSAFCVAEMAESTFLHAYSDMLGEETPPRGLYQCY